MKRLFLITLAAAAALTGLAQRATDDLGRGLVAMKADQGVFCSWRITAAEWDAAAYNIYRDGTKLNQTPLRVSNFNDPDGSTSASYTVTAVIDGKESAHSPSVTPWSKNYTVIKPRHAAEINCPLIPNDATVADVDGDGELEILMKYDNGSGNFHDGDNGIFTVVECLEMDGQVKWWINFGPNIGDFQNNEINIVATDWDGDGRAEVVFRAADGTVIHQADGSTYTVGDASLNYRGSDFPSGQWFMHWGKEYLVYADGLTGKPYECIDYPLVRVPDEANPSGLLSGASYDDLVNKQWGDGYGHRSSKYFFAAPYLDGRKPSLFLSRGIYTKIMMVTYDIDPATHRLTERWRWNDLGGSWYGQGYHNIGIADVDWDGRDEIVYGSMVIDDNGHGLSTTGLGHGDAQHCGDFDPYSHGQEIFACNEDNPNNNFRDATTSKIYYRTTGGNDDGRSNMGNFIDEYPGAEGISSKDNAIVCGASHRAVEGDTKGSVSVTQNFRVYWDGDLCDESFDYSNGKNTEGAIYKARQGRIALLEGSKTNNDTKGTPCLQGDILGDWREEYIMRDADNNIRIYSTDIPTDHRVYSLWFDHQYRNAMNWQMCGYNQPPHVSFWLSEFEGITTPPAPLTMTGRTEVGNNGTIGTELNGKHVIVCETNDMQLTAADGAAPSVLTVNTPTWVEGHDDNSRITSATFTHTIASGTFGGDMRLVKQGDGKLILPDGKHTYTGATEIWAGTVALDGELTASPVWLNRFAVLETNSLKLPKGLDMKYASVLKLGNDTKDGELTAGNLTLGFGSTVELDLFDDGTCDRINAAKLTVERKDWKNGPEYLQPIFRITLHGGVPAEEYFIGDVAEVEGNLDDIILLGADGMKKQLLHRDGKLYLAVAAYRAGKKTWQGGEDATWNLDSSLSFLNAETGANDVFVPGDEVTFDDSASATTVTLRGRLQPSAVTFSNGTKDYTLTGEGQIVGDAKLVKEGEGSLTVNNLNSYTGGTYINGGKLTAGTFANKIGTDLGALGGIDQRIYISNGATLATNASATLGQRITVSKGNAAIEVPPGKELTLTSGVTGADIGQKLYKRGAGTLNLAAANSVTRLVIEEGTVNAAESGDVISLPGTVEFVKGSLYDPADIYTYSTNPTNYVVAEGNSGSLYLDSRCVYNGKLTGAGTLTVYAAGPRCDLNGDWSKFEGTLVAAYHKRGSYDPDFKWNNDLGMPKATLSINSGVTFNAQGKNVKLAAVKGSGVYNGTGTLTLEGDGDISYSGTFAGKPKVVKTGKGDLKLTKLMTEINSLTVKNGQVSLMASKTPYNTVMLTAPLTLEGSGELRGRGTVANVTVNSGGVIKPGSISTTSPHRYGPIYSTGNVTVKDGGIADFYLRVAGKSNDCSYLDVAGKLEINGTIRIEANPDYAPAPGDTFTLWKAGSFAGTPSFQLPALPEGLEWDTAGLTDGTGVLKVSEAAAVGTLQADEPVECTVTLPSGLTLGTVATTAADAEADARRELGLRPGLYILTLRGAAAVESRKVRL